MRCGPASSTCQVVQRDSTLSGSGPFSHGTYPCPHRCLYHGLTGAALTAALSHHAPSVSQEPTPRRTEHWRGEPRKASLGHPFVPFPIPNHLCMPSLGYTRVPRPQMAIANRVQAIGNPPPTCTPPRSQALLPPASRRNESPTSGNPVRWVVGKGLPGVIIPNVDLVTRSGAGSRPYNNGTWNEGAARRPQRNTTWYYLNYSGLLALFL